MPPTGDRIGSAWYELAASNEQLRADLARAEQDLREAGIRGEKEFAQPIERGAERAGDAIVAMARSVGGIQDQSATELANALARAQAEAEDALVALRALSREDLSEDEARRYADAINDIEAEAKVTASELRELQASQPEFDTPELRDATQNLDRLGKEANEAGNEFRELARTNADATLGRAAKQSRLLASGMDDASKKSGGLLGQLKSVHGALLGLGLAIGAQQILGFFTSAIDKASDLGETVSKASQIFGAEAIPALERWTASSATAFGQSKQQAIDGAAGFAIFGKSAGLAGQELVGFSTDLTELASDLASFHNTSPEEAIVAIGAALRGESEPIRRYGVLLDEATLRQRAMKLGIIETTTQALTPQQRVLAAHAEILAQTTDAQGDFARTSEELANQQRIQAARLEDAMADLGEKLLPLALGFTEFASDVLPEVIESLEGLIGILGPVGQLLADQADVILPALVAVLGIHLIKSLKGVGLQAKLTGVAMKGMLGPIGLLLIAAEGLEATSDGVRDFMLEATRGKEAATSIRAIADEMADLGPLGKAAAEKIHDAGISVDEFREIVEAAGGDSRVALQALSDSGYDLGKALASLDQHTDAMGIAFGRDIPAALAATKDSAASLDQVLGGLDDGMRGRVEAVLKTVRNVPGGVAATLEDGSTIVAGSAETMVGGIVSALERADEAAQDIAREIPGNIAKSILEGRDAVTQAAGDLADAATDPLVERARIGEIRAQMREQNQAIIDARQEGDRAALLEARATQAQLEIELAGHLLRQNPKSKEAARLLGKYFRSEDPATQAAVQALLDAVGVRQEQLALDAEQHAVDTAMALPEATIDARSIAEAEQRATNVAVGQAAAELLDPMRSHGFDAGEEFASAISDPRNELNARNAGLSLNDSAKDGADGSMFTIGRLVGLSYGDGLYSAQNYVFTAAGVLRASVGGHLQFSGSPPYTHSKLIGQKVAETWGDGLVGGLRSVIADVPTALSGVKAALAAAVTPTLAPLPVAPSAVMAALGGAQPLLRRDQPEPATSTPTPTVVEKHTHLHVTGREPVVDTAREAVDLLQRMSWLDG